MIDTIFIEEAIAKHERTEEILSRFPRAHQIEISRYQEVFNKRTQNFRIQKKNPALILARKHENFVLPAPHGFGLGSTKNFYFSHMYNCLYDCRYCFLQGMYSSANYLVFVNFEDFHRAIELTIETNQKEKMTFFSGYDCDSLAFEKVSGFVKETLPLIARYPEIELELRTKSVQLEPLISERPLQNCIVAFSLMPEELAQALDKKAPSIRRRITALQYLGEKGWPIGLRFDPLIYSHRWEDRYKNLVKMIVENVPLNSIHSVSYGPLRYPKKMFSEISKLYPEESLFSFPITENKGFVSYGEKIETEMSNYLVEELSPYISQDKFFQCITQV